MALLINGNAYDWANLTISFLGTSISQITKISYDSKQDKKDNYGWYNQPISRSYGNVTYTGSMELYQDTWRAICQAAPNGDPLQIPPFTVSVSYGNFNQSSVVSATDVLSYVEFMENPMNAGQGELGLKVTVPLIIAGIQRFV